MLNINIMKTNKAKRYIFKETENYFSYIYHSFNNFSSELLQSTLFK